MITKEFLAQDEHLILSPTLIMDEAMISQIEGILRESIIAVTATLPA